MDYRWRFDLWEFFLDNKASIQSTDVSTFTLPTAHDVRSKHRRDWLAACNGTLYPICERQILTLRLLMSYIYMEHLFLMFLDHTQRRSTVGRTPLDE